MREIHHFIDGQSKKAQTGRFQNVYDPSTGKVQALVELASADFLAEAVAGAKAAQPAWAATNPQKRARVMFAFKALLERDMEDLARLLSSEHGKTVADAKGDIQRGLEVIEFACGIPHLLKGEFTEGAGPGIDMYSMRQPLGVVAGITPFNFPAMIPMWMFGVAIACGNAFICKPSEKDPSVPIRLGELLKEAGLPDGIYQVVNGDKVVVDAILEHPDVKAVSFVGSSAVAEYIYAKGATYGKRVQAMGGAKNHAIILPDADLDQVTNDLIGAGYGSAGERCMAISVAVPVTDKVADALIARLKPRVEALKVGPSLDPEVDYGPLISREHRQNVINWIDKSVQEGAELVVDGRTVSFQGYEDGFYLGGSLIDRVTPTMESYKTEIFGPVLQIARAEDFDSAIALPNAHQYGNGTAIYTRNGRAAREFASRVEVGMVGINVPIPVPLAYHSFGGWKRSAFGDANQHGTEGVRFFTKVKTVTARWPEGAGAAEFVIPTMK
ncbi:putative 3-oxopropanoate dehydrogenase [Candidatus Phycosocius bacilliformis]|uniref:methylmalonate-semialdehyde dehydrogenase (CoA acylating) n=1 Tax=Candidatus Phycosocius bacilliformis TaxID=1445552 RepID=A0A2P2E694_9PROT|nr:CoA-acylating methylmalonate-semialdehyde dehydrogenase [Candidatus Phycosocius bacilliformis]GBF56562.1 putative 3-oxopropanoate dehydrogenase [Candidatus Phycosocius bacilliformis]